MKFNFQYKTEYRIAYWFGMFAVAAMVTVAVGILTEKM